MECQHLLTFMNYMNRIMYLDKLKAKCVDKRNSERSRKRMREERMKNV